MHSHNLSRGALLILVSELLLVASGMVVKQLGGELPTEQVVFVRNLFGLLLLLPWLMRNGLSAVKTDQLRFHLMRAAIGVAAMSCLYYSWAQLPLAQAALMKQTAPFFMPLFAFWWLGERIPSMAKLAIAVGFGGVFLILNPTAGALDLALLVALCGAMLGALAKVVIRRMSGSEPARRIVFYFALFSTLISLLPALWSWVNPTLSQWLWLALMASTSTLAQLLLSRAYGLAPAGQLGPFTYASVAFAALFGWLLWHELLALHSWLGMLVVVAAGLLAMQGRRVPGSATA
ncbi:DMT family transporter [Marinobacterium arenosum]|uniref:DMT family transporter n=1 Tax=Marinobacterium arenosum TaxID=2862496 RepID=UPI001C988044|nr:DMT family transporter [Marinobacterium arenosum]MBY4677843.1 DMT family transporter [Marinobacterium arenosum]